MKRNIRIDGMTCGHCKNRVELLINSLDGYSNAVADVENKSLSFECDNFDEEFIKEEIEDLGFEYLGKVNL